MVFFEVLFVGSAGAVARRRLLFHRLPVLQDPHPHLGLLRRVLFRRTGGRVSLRGRLPGNGDQLGHRTCCRPDLRRAGLFLLLRSRGDPGRLCRVLDRNRSYSGDWIKPAGVHRRDRWACCRCRPGYPDHCPQPAQDTHHCVQRARRSQHDRGGLLAATGTHPAGLFRIRVGVRHHPELVALAHCVARAGGGWHGGAVA